MLLVLKMKNKSSVKTSKKMNYETIIADINTGSFPTVDDFIKPWQPCLAHKLPVIHELIHIFKAKCINGHFSFQHYRKCHFIGPSAIFWWTAIQGSTHYSEPCAQTTADTRQHGGWMLPLNNSAHSQCCPLSNYVFYPRMCDVESI